MNLLNIFPAAGLLVILFLIAGSIIFLNRKKGIQASSGKQTATIKKFFVYPVFSIILLVWLFELLKPVFNFPVTILPEIVTNRLFENLYLKISGAALILFSLAFFTLTILHFNTSLRFGLDENNLGKLITHGVFAVTRNPFFISFIIYFTGVALIFASVFFIGFAILAAAGIHIFILKEERFLRKFYRDEYEIYSKKVPRYF